jgi:hypothetical protein
MIAGPSRRSYVSRPSSNCSLTHAALWACPCAPPSQHPCMPACMPPAEHAPGTGKVMQWSVEGSSQRTHLLRCVLEFTPQLVHVPKDSHPRVGQPRPPRHLHITHTRTSAVALATRPLHMPRAAKASVRMPPSKWMPAPAFCSLHPATANIPWCHSDCKQNSRGRQCSTQLRPA